MISLDLCFFTWYLSVTFKKPIILLQLSKFHFEIIREIVKYDLFHKNKKITLRTKNEYRNGKHTWLEKELSFFLIKFIEIWSQLKNYLWKKLIDIFKATKCLFKREKKENLIFILELKQKNYAFSLFNDINIHKKIFFLRLI